MDWIQILVNTASSIISPVTIAYALAAIGLSVHFGFAGLLNMGIAGFMAMGAYGYAISILTFGFPWWGGVLVGLGAGMVFALVLGIPTLRLRGDYLAIVTIAAAEVVRLLFLTSAFDPVTGSADGLTGYHTGFRDANPIAPGSYGFGPWVYNEVGWWVRIVGFLALAIAVFAVWRIMSSPWGRVLKGIREDEDAVRALGKNVFSYKLQALVLGGVIAAAGGIVYAMDRNVNSGVYVTSLTFFVYTALLLGGAATIFGPVLGAVLFYGGRVLIREVANAYIPSSVMSDTQTETFSLIVVGTVLMLLVIFRPQGILGDKRELKINV